jgi:phosphate transport system substrate-binding protein
VTLERAQAFERGVNGPRDYREAAQLYAQACSSGKGDIAACHRWMDAAFSARGVDVDVRTRPMLVIAKALCERRDAMGCLVGALSRDEASKAAMKKLPDPDEACGPGDPGACEAALAMQFPNFQGSSGREARQRDLEDRACRAGVLAGCLALLQGVENCTYEPGASRCVDKLVREWKKYESDDRLHALAEVTAACDHGDAQACDVLPGRQIAPRVLCDAHDWNACGALGCLGDAAMAKLAESHAAHANCYAIQNRANAGTLPEPPPRPGLPADPPLPPVSPSNRPLFDALAFWRHATEPEEFNWPAFDIHNLGTRPITLLRTTTYAYDKAGALVARSDARRLDGFTLEAGKSLTDETYSYLGLPAEAVSFSVCYDEIGFTPRLYWEDSVPCPLAPPARSTATAALSGAGSSVQRWFHSAAAQAFDRVRARYGFLANFSDTAVSASELGLAELTARTVAFAGSETASGPDTVRIPILVGSLAIMYSLPGIDQLRLSPATLARIYQHDITTWNDRAIAADNPGVKLPALPIIAYHDAQDTDATRQFTSFLEREARGVWRLKGGAALTWPAGAMPAMGLSTAAFLNDGAIGYADFAQLMHGRYGGRFARIRNRAGNFVLPTAESIAAAARELTGKPTPGAIEARNVAAYPLAFPSWIVVSQNTDRATATMLAPYLAYLLGDGQRLLPALGLAPLPPGIAAAARARAAQLAP